MPTPPPSSARRMFGAHLSASRQHIERLSSPRTRLGSPRRVVAAPSDTARIRGSFAAAYAQQRHWARMATPPAADTPTRYRPVPQSAPQLTEGRAGLVSADGKRPGCGGPVDGAAMRPHTSALPLRSTTSDAALKLPDSPATWDWGGAPDSDPQAVPMGETAERGSDSPRLQEMGSWFDEDAWSRIKADRSRRKAAQQEAQEEYWRVVVRPWLAQKKHNNRETMVQRRLRKARQEQSQLHRQLDEKRHATRHAAHALLKDMRALLTLDALQDMSPKQAKMLERWVDEIMLRREIPLSLMEHVKSMHEQLIRQLFRNIDEDGSGLLDSDEVRLLASKLGAL